MRASLVLVALVMATACGTPRLNQWSRSFTETRLMLEKDPVRGEAMAAELELTAPDPVARDQARVLPLLNKDLESARDGLAELMGSRDSDTAAAAGYRLGELLLERGYAFQAEEVLIATIKIGPDTVHARDSIELLVTRLWSDLQPEVLDRRLAGLDHPLLRGQLLFRSGQEWLTRGRGDRTAALERFLLCGQTALRSPYRDDCEDGVLALLSSPKDRIDYLEGVIALAPGDDPARLESTRNQALEFKLAREYQALGNGSRALFHLGRVVNLYPGVRWKDDALWTMAEIYQQSRDPAGERRALRTLISNLPHSGHSSDAQKRLEELGDGLGTE